MILTIFSDLAYGFKNKTHVGFTAIWYVLSIIAVAIGIYNFFYELIDIYQVLIDKGFVYYMSNINVLTR